MEINKNLSLEMNKLDDLDCESSNNDHVGNISPQPQPIEKFKVGEQLIEFSDLNVHFTNTSAEKCCELFMWLFQNLKNPPKEKPTYAQ